MKRPPFPAGYLITDISRLAQRKFFRQRTDSRLTQAEIFAGAGTAVYLRGGRYIETDNACIKADKSSIGAEAAWQASRWLITSA